MHQEPHHRGILGMDIQRFSRKEWTDPTKARLRGRLHRLLDQGLVHVGIDPSLTDRSDTGDGLWLLVDTAVSTLRLLHLAAALAVILREDNRQSPPSERMRLRVVVHAGEVLCDQHGYTSDSVIHAARILDAGVGRAILDNEPDADLVLLVSEQVYQNVVRHNYPGVDSTRYQPVWVRCKETRARAWAYLPNQLSMMVSARSPLPSTVERGHGAPHLCQGCSSAALTIPGAYTPNGHATWARLQRGHLRGPRLGTRQLLDTCADQLAACVDGGVRHV